MDLDRELVVSFDNWDKILVAETHWSAYTIKAIRYSDHGCYHQYLGYSQSRDGALEVLKDLGTDKLYNVRDFRDFTLI